MARRLVAVVLGWQVRRLQNKNNFKVIAVAGSIGKTSTKLAIASVLKTGLKVQYQDGNYNDLVTVPLIFFGLKTPSLFNPLAWLAIFWQNELTLQKKYPYDVVVVELGTDGPGQLIQHRSYLKVDIGVLTAIAPEHMQFFKDLDAVAKEESEIAILSAKLIFNSDLCQPKYMDGLKVNKLRYGFDNSPDFRALKIEFIDDTDHVRVPVLSSGQPYLSIDLEHSVSSAEVYSILAAVSVATELGLDKAQIRQGIGNIQPVNGRMNRLPGVKSSVIIDDTYNASPVATKAALDTLYQATAPYKIAVLGNMNELGSYSKEAHIEVGHYCDPKRVDMVITLGPDANEFLAPAAESKGCKVQSFDSPYTAGEYLKSVIKDQSVILVKGSQNKVFAEETVKIILANSADKSKLVRQSKDWLKIKQKVFKT